MTSYNGAVLVMSAVVEWVKFHAGELHAGEDPR